MFAIKRGAELFATFRVLAAEHSTVSAGHVGFLTAQVQAIIADGDFAAGEPELTARAVLNATNRFHDPTHAAEWHSPQIEADSAAVVSFILDGLRAGDILASRTAAEKLPGDSGERPGGNAVRQPGIPGYDARPSFRAPRTSSWRARSPGKLFRIGDAGDDSICEFRLRDPAVPMSIGLCLSNNTSLSCSLSRPCSP